MFGEHHDNLALEFPQFKEKIHRLKMADHHFKHLYEQYQALDREIYRIEEQIETPSDAYTEEMKKKRVALKDQLYAILSRE